MAKLKVLTLSSLYPNAEQPGHGVFIEQRVRQLLARYDVDLRVVAPVPWFPLKGERFGEYGKYARVPAEAERHGVSILHPRYPVIPKFNVGMNVSPLLMARALKPVLKKMIADGFDFDVIDCHYYFPDGVAAALLGKWLNKPVVITARGSDLSLLPDYPVPRRWILWAEKRAAASVTVCAALRDRLIELGGDPEHCHVLANGVDLQVFNSVPPVQRKLLRAELGFTRRTLLQVGNLIELKGQHISIAALADMPDTDLVLVGRGVERETLERLAASLNVADRVRFVGAIPHADIQRYMNAADVLLLPSSREGLANVMLESLACGTPVIATNVWGAPEVITAPEAGRLITERSPAGLKAGIESLFADMPERAVTREHAEQFGWDVTSGKLFELLTRIGFEARGRQS